eukprot:503090-Rhodomonas_salina.1
MRICVGNTLRWNRIITACVPSSPQLRSNAPNSVQLGETEKVGATLRPPASFRVAWIEHEQLRTSGSRNWPAHGPAGASCRLEKGSEAFGVGVEELRIAIGSCAMILSVVPMGDPSKLGCM